MCTKIGTGPENFNTFYLVKFIYCDGPSKSTCLFAKEVFKASSKQNRIGKHVF